MTDRWREREAKEKWIKWRIMKKRNWSRTRANGSNRLQLNLSRQPMNCYYTLLLTFSSMSLLQVAIKPHINWPTAILHPENPSLEQGSLSQTIPGTSHHPQRILSQWTPVRIFGLTIPKNPHKSRAVAPVDTNGDPFYDNPWKLCQGSQRIDVLAAIPLKFNSIKDLSSKNVLKSPKLSWFGLHLVGICSPSTRSSTSRGSQIDPYFNWHLAVPQLTLKRIRKESQFTFEILHNVSNSWMNLHSEPMEEMTSFLSANFNLLIYSQTPWINNPSQVPAVSICFGILSDARGFFVDFFCSIFFLFCSIWLQLWRLTMIRAPRSSAQHRIQSWNLNKVSR